ncbi:MAG TPA: amidohydrolase [Chitinophagaceae bacterium]|nr:amidohydrolase [Chitinophagaceae bacterium]
MTHKNFFLLTASLLINFVTNAQLPQRVKQLAYQDSSRLTEMFKDIHQNPELGFMEVRTSGIIEKELKALGYEVITGIAKTGLAGILKNGNGPIVMYRADMDCNSVKETTGLLYASTKTMKKEDGTEVPVMHACGHDAHVTWMLGIAKIMAAIKNEWKGTLVFIAQPAEELMVGAEAMVKDRLYERGVPVPDYLFGLHTWPIRVGTLENGFNERTAGSDQLDVTFYGIGGHGSSPQLGKDPIVMGSSAVMQYQTIISRSIAAQDAAVLTVGAFQAGIENNVIPPSALLKLNLRWFNEKDRNILLDGIKRINEGIAIANNLPKELYPSIKMKSKAFPLVNNTGMVNKINTALSTVMAPASIINNTPSVMGSEDFHHLVIHNKKTVYDYIFVGIASEEAMATATREGKKYPFSNHNGNYQVDLSAIPLGTVIGAVGLIELFKK